MGMLKESFDILNLNVTYVNNRYLFGITDGI